ncbi:hypothetical protein I7I48_04106 [Histoplasma ohiense]|nr:hypothetical protein I7I48_04106 [Histoplasma ohiense (nom. inval.)]
MSFRERKPSKPTGAKQLSIVNDTYSYEKQEETSRTGHKERAFLCSAVKVLAEETKFGIPATKRVLLSFEALSTQDDQLDSSRRIKHSSAATSIVQPYQMISNSRGCLPSVTKLA